MRYLLDTHALLWWRQDDPRLPHTWDRILGNPTENEVCVSIFSLWEIAIKRTLGKLELEGSLADFSGTLQAGHGFRLLPLEVVHLERLEQLPAHHRDPFDRLLIAQAIETGAVAVTNDRNWRPYPVKTQW